MDLDGSHTTTLRGEECCGYQGRKKRKTTNAIYVTDRQGILLAISPPFRVRTTTSTTSPRYFGDCSQGLRLQAFPYRDSSSTQMLVLTQNSSGVCIRDMGLSKHRLQEAQREEEFLDELLYKERYSIERTNAWMDSYRSVLNRFDTTLASWEGWNYIAFILILLKKIRKRGKSR